MLLGLISRNFVKFVFVENHFNFFVNESAELVTVADFLAHDLSFRD
jgi:hypothetical protein